MLPSPQDWEHIGKSTTQCPMRRRDRSGQFRKANNHYGAKNGVSGLQNCIVWISFLSLIGRCGVGKCLFLKVCLSPIRRYHNPKSELQRVREVCHLLWRQSLPHCHNGVDSSIICLDQPLRTL
jgi:hypothetical protein